MRRRRDREELRWIERFVAKSVEVSGVGAQRRDAAFEEAGHVDSMAGLGRAGIRDEPHPRPWLMASGELGKDPSVARVPGRVEHG
jgi:hypothetical protein